MTPSPEAAYPIDPREHDALLRNDMAAFVGAVFEVVSPSVDLVWSDYLDLISARLAAVADGQIRRLIITLPPRHLKSICVSVALPAFVLGHRPSTQIMVVSYGQDLARELSDQTRKVMASAVYQRIFDTRLTRVGQATHLLTTTDGGRRRATSIDGVATGVGADLLIFDDPQKPNETLSDAIRRATNDAYQNTFLSRLNDPNTCAQVIVMQRLHENDFVGHVLGLGADWEVLNLPAIAEADEAYAYETFLGRSVFRRAEGEALNPERLSLDALAELRAAMGEAAWSSQFMQRPTPAGGGYVKPAWFRRYAQADLPESFDRIVQSWDTAATLGLQSDFSVCTTWGVRGKQRYLLDVFRKRLEYPDLKRAVIEHARLHGATSIVIEDKSSGTQLIQDFRRDGMSRIEVRKPSKNKEMRMAGQTAQIEAGFVFLPEEAHWLPDYLHELAMFPNGKYDDQVDFDLPGAGGDWRSEH